MLVSAERNWTDRDISEHLPPQRIRHAIPNFDQSQSANTTESSGTLTGVQTVGVSIPTLGVFENVDVQTIPQTYTELVPTFYTCSPARRADVSGLVSVDLSQAPFEVPITMYFVPPVYFGPQLRPNAEHVTRLSRALFQTLQQEPVLDGFYHPGEPILEKMFRGHPADSSDWVISCFSKSEFSSRAADILKLLCRFKPRNKTWRQNVVEVALRSPSHEVRDVAIQAVESWAEPSLIGLLRSHSEKVPWLAEYARQVLKDLGG
jgi:hypothetical protein